jgi:hypothetical protein
MPCISVARFCRTLMAVRWRHAEILAMLGPIGPGCRSTDPPVRYEVTLEPSHQPWLLVLDAAPNRRVWHKDEPV